LPVTTKVGQASRLPGEHYRRIHPKDAAESDAALAAEKAKAEAKAKADAEAKAKAEADAKAKAEAEARAKAASAPPAAGGDKRAA